MSIPESEQDYAWVTDALAADAAGPMPDHVHARVLAALGAATDRGSVGSSTASRARRTERGAVPPAAVPPAAVPPAAVPPDSWRGAGGPAGTKPTTTAPRDPSSGGNARRGRSNGSSALDQQEDFPVAGATGDGRTGSGARVPIGGRRSDRVEAESDRRHFLLYRMLPVAAAMVVIAAASGVVATQLRDDESTVVAQESAVQDGPKPNGLVATGTSYTAADLTEQAVVLLAAVSQGGAAAPVLQAESSDATSAAALSAGDPVPSAAASRAAAAGEDSDDALIDPVPGSPLASAAAYRECARTLGAAEGVLPAAVDLAIFEGAEAAIVVLPNRAGDGYEVIVTDRFCSADTERASETFTGG